MQTPDKETQQQQKQGRAQNKNYISIVKHIINK